jgi:hypothetical protein
MAYEGYDERPSFNHLTGWNRQVAKEAYRTGWEPGSTIWDECTCLQVSRATWDCDAEYAEDPMCWFHGEDLDVKAWVIEQGADWCHEHGYDPTTGKELS